MTETPADWTVLRLLTWTQGYLQRSGLQEPRLSAELLLAKVLGCKRVDLYIRHDRLVRPEHLAAYRQLIKRAAEGEPIAYLTGQREFYSLSFKVTPDVLIPRPETELLVDAALAVAKKQRGSAVRMWDVCTGSGCVAVAAAKWASTLGVLATDISEAALGVAAENMKAHGLERAVYLAHADLLDSPKLTATSQPPPFDISGPYDVITANPPYVSQADMDHLPKDVLREPHVALTAGATGLEVIERLIAGVGKYLRSGGTFAMEMGLGQADRVHQLLKAAGHFQDIAILKDAAGIERTVVAVRK